jgi:hypothetical protein
VDEKDRQNDPTEIQEKCKKRKILGAGCAVHITLCTQ